MDTPLEIARENFLKRHYGECVTCKYYKTGKAGYATYEWCDREETDIECIDECEGYIFNDKPDLDCALRE